jgi:formamidopyrimidine-DNA glycosylase
VPELPEVETTRRGIAPHVAGQRIARVRVHDARLRWPLDPHLARRLCGQRVLSVDRRAKYLLLRLERGTLVVHLGMSGSLRITLGDEARRPHDHLELVMESSRLLRYHDPRRFGSVHYVTGDPLAHWLLANLGVEPLGTDFDGSVLERAARGRRSAVKTLIMDSRVVVGVGNIYACEALYLAGIHPARPARRVAAKRYARLAESIQEVLGRAIRDGGTTLRDFVNGVGEPGYFAQALQVYGRAGRDCHACGRAVTSRVIAQRNTFFCPACQR